MIFFTADSHFCHDNIRGFCKRPFSSVEEMNSIIVDNWNSVIQSKDIVYHLGDFAFYKNDKEFNLVQEIFRELRGEKHFITGNHDKNKILEKLP